MINNSKHKTSLLLLKKWWCSLIMIPFMGYSLHQIYWTLRFNIFFSVTYEYPFPLNAVHLLLDNFLLITHEAGHTFFSVFGNRFITILGGSLFQIILPLFIVFFFWMKHRQTGLQLSLCMLGYSWFDVAGYAADGGARQLPLIGGLTKESHDWFNLLYQLNWLDHDMFIAVILTLIGVACYIFAVGIPLINKQYRELNIDMEF